MEMSGRGMWKLDINLCVGLIECEPELNEAYVCLSGRRNNFIPSRYEATICTVLGMSDITNVLDSV